MSIWSSEKINQLMELAKDKALSAADIGKIMGVSRNAIIGKMDRLHLRRQKLPAHQLKYNPPATSGARGKKYALEKDEEHRERCAAEMFIQPLKPGLTLMDLTRKMCHYPYGMGPYTFCGHKTHEHHPYCEGHQKLTHTKARKPINVPPDKNVIQKQSY